MADIDKFVEVDRKEYLTLLSPLAEKLGVDLHDVLRMSMDAAGVEVEYVTRQGAAYQVGSRHTARLHVFDGVVFE